MNERIYINAQNRRYCSSINLRQTSVVHFHNAKIDVWCATWIVGHKLFENTDGSEEYVSDILRSLFESIMEEGKTWLFYARRYYGMHKPLIPLILLHVSGFLGSVAWALSRGGAVVHCCVSFATQQYRRVYQQHCCARDNRHGDVYVHGIVVFDWYRQCLFGNHLVQTCVFGYGLLLVGRLSSYQEIARKAREFIPWTVNTVDRQG
jgi:hypothetical protein